MPYWPVQLQGRSPQLPTPLLYAISMLSSSSSWRSSTHLRVVPLLVGSPSTASRSLPRETGSAGAAYEMQRSGNVREIVRGLTPIAGHYPADTTFINSTLPTPSNDRR